jgi:hypothetical protein
VPLPDSTAIFQCNITRGSTKTHANHPVANNIWAVLTIK